MFEDFRKQYYFSQTPANWQNSQQFCENLWPPLGGKLTQIYYQHENQWLKNTINRSIWLGATNSRQWRDGCPIKYSRNNVVYSNDTNMGKALFLQQNGDWSFRNINDSLHFVCEVKIIVLYSYAHH